MANQRFLFVDGLRGLAALSVALFHIGRDFLQLDFLFYLGHGVTVFFVLSGFVISHSLMNKQIDSRFFLLFTIKRSVRLDPAYWVAIAVAIIMLWLPAVIFGYTVSLPSIGNIGLHMFYLQEFADSERINIVFWTLCYEIQFYLVFCALLGFNQRLENKGNRARLVLFGTIFLLSLLWPLAILAQPLQGLFIDLWYLFLLGVFARWAYQDKHALIILTISAALLLLLSDYQSRNFEITLVGVFTSAALYLAISADKMGRWLRWRWVQYLGMISYSLYLLHDMIGLYVRDTGIHLTAKYLHVSSLAINYAWCSTALLASILAAHLLHKLVEAPSHRLSRSLSLQSISRVANRSLQLIRPQSKF